MQGYSELLNKFDKILPHFDDGRINYTGAKEAPVINCFIKFQNEILLLKRSEKVSSYQGKWNSIGGFIDEAVSLENKAITEAKEELGITEENIKSIQTGKRIDFYDKDIDITWYIFPVLIELKAKPEIKLDWEHTDFVWINPEDLNKYDTVSDLENILKALI